MHARHSEYLLLTLLSLLLEPLIASLFALGEKINLCNLLSSTQLSPEASLKMAQQLKALAAKPNDLSLVPRTRRVERKSHHPCPRAYKTKQSKRDASLSSV